METNTNVQTSPGAMDVEISIEGLYVNMGLKVDVASHTLSYVTEQVSSEVSVIPESLTIV